MKQYPSILNATGFLGRPCIAFYKYDGSNLRFEYSRKSGWHKFGTRSRLFDKNDPDFGSAIDIFLEKHAPGLDGTIKKDKLLRNAQSIIIYAEFFGPNSFTGQHQANDSKELVIFDANVHKHGILGPREFLDTLQDIALQKSSIREI